MDQFGQAATLGGGPDDADAELARAIEASYAMQTGGAGAGAGAGADEDDGLAEAMRLSVLEEEARKRRELGLPEEDEAMPDAARAHAASSSGRFSAGAELGGATDTMDSVQAEFAAIEASGILDEPMAVSSGREAGGRAPMEQDDFASGAANGLLDGILGDHARLGARAGGGEALAPQNMDAAAMEAAAVAEQADETDRQLAMAIEASYSAQTEAGQQMNDEEMFAQALRVSQQEEEARQRASLRGEQEAELAESVLMDQMREEEQKRRRTEEQQLERMETERQAEEAGKKERDERQKKEAEELKRSRIPLEPPAGESGRVDFMIRLPDGKKIRRAFRGADTVGQVYDYVDVEAAEAVANTEQYRLVATMPRVVYEDRSLTLEGAGLKGQCAIIVEAVQAQ